MAEAAELNLNGKTFTLPVVEGSEQEKAIDITKLRDQTGYVTLDSGYKNTGATKSGITFLDGEQGILRYRGYPIEQLAEKSSFLEVSYLLIYGELPTTEQFKTFQERINNHTLVHEQTKKIIEVLPTITHPMGILASFTASMSAFYPESLLTHRPFEEVELSILRLIAKFPTLVSWIHKKRTGHAYVYPLNKLGYIENFLNMMFSMPSEDYQPHPAVVDALDKLLILHADHEQNCSTSTVRIVGSSHANLYASISAGICALWGPLHGGANQEVLEMLEEIHADGGSDVNAAVAKYVAKAKNKDDNFRLMGFGHRVYKNFDPRAKIIKGACDNVLNALGINDPLLEIAKKLEEAALTDEYFIQRKLYPNVDFYSGIIYRAIGIPTDMFTVMFALGRLPGWIAQWKEMMDNNEPIGRPRQIYTGATERQYSDIKGR